MLPTRTHKLRWILGISLGAICGLILRLLITFHRPDHRPRLSSDADAVMTIGFLFIAPFAVGFITIYVMQRDQQCNWWQRIFVPWMAILISTGVTSLLVLEGAICILLSLPITLTCSSLGGVLAGVIYKVLPRFRHTPAACLAVLPLILAPVEAGRTQPTQIRSVNTDIVIHASPSVVWRNIERVPLIRPEELRPNWTHRIGFPRPLEATLSHEGVGGVRHATFEHGVLFVETITDWEPEKLLAFSIRADAADIPPGTLDDHVKVGGRYFDVFRGEYRLEPRGHGDVVLHLSSQERLTTDFNFYSGFWSDAIMRNLQESILQVIKKRCEAESPTPPAKPAPAER